jgi:hypothetical protein
MTSLKESLAGMKPKKAAKLLRKLGLEVPPKQAGTPPADPAKKPPEETKETKPQDLFKKRQITEFETRIAALEAENKQAKIDVTEAQKSSKLDRALSDLPWASVESRDMARDYYLPKLKWSDDGTELLIGDALFDKHIRSEIPAKFENLLAPTGKGGAGLTRGQGTPGSVDIDALTAFNSTPEQKAEAARTIAALMGAK